jgi:hypothetical protein
VQVVVEYALARIVPIGFAVNRGLLSGRVRTQQVMTDVTPRGLLGEQMRTREFIQQLAGHFRVYVEEAGRGRNRDRRPGMGGKPPECPRRKLTQLAVRPGECCLDAAGSVSHI